MIFSNKKQKSQQGFTLFIAVIITSIVILLGVTIAGIMQRDTLITASSRASTQAFYAADTALECALRWDDRDAPEFADGASTISCAGNDSIPINSCSGDCDFSFVLDDRLGANVCAEVSIEKDSTPLGDCDTVYDLEEGGVEERVHIFPESCNFNVVTDRVIEYLIVAGGGGGGLSDDSGGGGGGGGGGGLLAGTTSIAAGSHSVIVTGGGGAGVDNTNPPASKLGKNGSNSSFNGIEAIGGGGGGAEDGGPYDGKDGGSGGGAIDEGSTQATPGSGISGQGHDGGLGLDNGPGGGAYGGGGGGAGGPGGLTNNGRSPGAGFVSDITGSNVTYAAGGLGGHAKIAPPTEGRDGTDGLGEGGGGGFGNLIRQTNNPGGDGGDGVVIIRYVVQPEDPDALDVNTQIEARGRNTCEPSSRQVERALRSFY